MSSTTCPQLIPLYTAWKDGLAKVREARLRFQESGSEEDSRAFDEAREFVKKARLEYRKAGYETTVEYRGMKICQVEALVVERMDQMLEDGGGREALLRVNQGHIEFLSVSDNRSRFIDQVVGLTTYLTKLTELHCFNTQLTNFPELPDSLTELFCQNTQISQIYKLPDSLTKLVCNNNFNLSALPELPYSLVYLNASNTGLSKLPELPVSLSHINISFTPVAEESLIQDRLDGFQLTHPNVTVSY
jgi:hypothetical protein